MTPYRDPGKRLEASRKSMSKKRAMLIPVNPVNPKMLTPEAKVVEGLTKTDVNPVNPVSEKIAELHQLVQSIKTEPAKPESIYNLPVYNWEASKAGDRVRKWQDGRWVAMTVPTLDADGNPFEDYTPGRLVAQPNYARPVSYPDPKPIKRKPVRPFRR